MRTHQKESERLQEVRKQSHRKAEPNHPRHRIAALWRAGMKPKGRVWAARGARGR